MVKVNWIGIEAVQAFYEELEVNDIIAERVDNLSGSEGTIEKILEGTVIIAGEYGFQFTLAELKAYLIQKEDIEII